jgi:hypothetical protein
MTRLRRVYPLTVTALWTSVLALFLVALRVPRSAPLIGIVATMAVPVIAVSALWSLASSASVALIALQNANVHVAPGGFASMFAGALLSAIAVGMLVLSEMKRAPTQLVQP